MPKVTMEFDLSYGSDDIERWEIFQKAERLDRAIEEYDNKLRSLVKYSEDPKDAWAKPARELLHEILWDYVYES